MRCNKKKTCVKGEICGERPPLRSISANCSDERNSYSVSPPNKEAIKTPSGFKLRITFEKQPGRSLTQCKLKLDITKSNELSGNCKQISLNNIRNKYINI